MSWFITNLVSAFLLPPLNLLIVAMIGLWFWRKRPLLARSLISLSIALLWLLSTPYCADYLLHELEGSPQAVDLKNQHADAIVVLGGGTYFHAPEYGNDTVSEAALLRLRYAAKLYRETGKPILVTGGKPLGNSLSEGEQMKQVLTQEFNVPVQWVEGESDNTFENARMSFKILKAAGISKIYLLTHAWHMPRSRKVFENAGFTVIATPTAYTTRYETDLLTFIPNAGSLHDSRIFMHEMIGMAWYQLKSTL
ncbi:MAG: YdcF family protein [Gallionellaceae bacterium]|nr:YdcF family protein [Gallionellaceae bacterium]